MKSNRAFGCISRIGAITGTYVAFRGARAPFPKLGQLRPGLFGRKQNTTAIKSLWRLAPRCVDHGRHHRTTFVGAGPKGGADGGMSGLSADRLDQPDTLDRFTHVTMVMKRSLSCRW